MKHSWKIALSLLSTVTLHGVNIEWSGAAAPTDLWGSTANWVGGTVPDSTANSALFNDTPTLTNVDVDGVYTVQSLIFDAGTNQYGIQPVFPYSNLFLFNQEITVSTAGTHFINVPLSTVNALTINATAGTGNITLGGDNSGLVGSGLTEGIVLNNIVLSVSTFENLGNPLGTLTFTNQNDVLWATETFTIPSTYQIVFGTTSQGIQVDFGNVLTIETAITRTGNVRKLEKLGGGTLILTGNNDFDDGVRIAEGILQVSSDGNLGVASGGITLIDTLKSSDSFTSAREVTLSDVGLPTIRPTIEVDDGKTLILTGTLSEVEVQTPLDKTGLGNLFLNGTNTNHGDVTVKNGNLSLNSTLVADVYVEPQGLLSGNNGSMTNLNNDGTVGPGNSIGTLFVTGNYTQSAGGNFDLEINAAGQNDILNVTGTAAIDGSVTVYPEPGLYVVGTTYDFLLTGGGITGTFAQLIESSPLDFQINYLPQGGVTFAQLEIIDTTAVEPTPITNLTGNALAVAEYLFCPEEINVTNQDFVEFLTALLSQTPSNFEKALINLSPAQFGALPLHNLNKDIAFSGALVDRIEQRMWCDRCNSSPSKKSKTYQDETRRTSVWGSLIGEWQKQKGIQEQYAFNDQTYGFTVGATHLFGEALLLSGGLGYSYSDLKWKNHKGSSDTNALYIAPSIGYSKNNYFVNFLAQFATNWNHVDRKISFPGLSRTARSHFTCYDLLARLDGGYQISVSAPNKDQGPFLLVPEASLSYLNVWQGSFSENGAGTLNLNVKSKHTAFLQPEVLLKILKECYVGDSCVIPMVKVGYVGKVPLSSANYQATLDIIDCPSDMTVKSFHKTTSQLVAGVGLVYKTLEHITAGCDYEAHLFDKNFIQTAKINFDWSF
ncbi:MAG: autotransporter domain-containing protein [Chlamydiales bacterium]|nr:autotransporter domain-containing protein [Chlamydiales bacterium]